MIHLNILIHFLETVQVALEKYQISEILKHKIISHDYFYRTMKNEKWKMEIAFLFCFNSCCY